MKHNIIRTLNLVFIMLLHTGCSEEKVPLEGLSFLKKEKFLLPVTNIRVKRCEGHMPLITMVEQWSREFLDAAGGAYDLVISIEEARITEESIRRQKNVTDWVTNPQSIRYVGDLSVVFDFIPHIPSRKKVSINFDVNGTRNVNDKDSLHKRNMIKVALCERLINLLTKRVIARENKIHTMIEYKAGINEYSGS